MNEIFCGFCGQRLACIGSDGCSASKDLLAHDCLMTITSKKFEEVYDADLEIKSFRDKRIFLHVAILLVIFLLSLV